MKIDLTAWLMMRKSCQSWGRGDIIKMRHQNGILNKRSVPAFLLCPPCCLGGHDKRAGKDGGKGQKTSERIYHVPFNLPAVNLFALHWAKSSPSGRWAARMTRQFLPETQCNVLLVGQNEEIQAKSNKKGKGLDWIAKNTTSLTCQEKKNMISL